MKTKTIRVTQEHIDKGENNDCYKCPVALAMTAAGLDGVFVGVRPYNRGQVEASIYIGTSEEIVPPKAVSRFIEAFDNREPVKPFTFRLTLPD